MPYGGTPAVKTSGAATLDDGAQGATLQKKQRLDDQEDINLNSGRQKDYKLLFGEELGADNQQTAAQPVAEPAASLISATNPPKAPQSPNETEPNAGEPDVAEFKIPEAKIKRRQIGGKRRHHSSDTTMKKQPSKSEEL